MFETTNLWHLGLLFWYSPIFFITWIIVRSGVVACTTRFLFFPLGSSITPFLLLILGGLSFGRFSASSGRQWWLWRTPCTVWTWLLRHFMIEPRSWSFVMTCYLVGGNFMRVANICILTTKEDAGVQIYGCLIYNIKEMSMHEKVPVDTTVGRTENEDVWCRYFLCWFCYLLVWSAQHKGSGKNAKVNEQRWYQGRPVDNMRCINEGSGMDEG